MKDLLKRDYLFLRYQFDRSAEERLPFLRYQFERSAEESLQKEIKEGQSSNRTGAFINGGKSLMRCQGLDIFQIVCPDTRFPSGFFPHIYPRGNGFSWGKNILFTGSIQNPIYNPAQYGNSSLSPIK